MLINKQKDRLKSGYVSSYGGNMEMPDIEEKSMEELDRAIQKSTELWIRYLEENGYYEEYTACCPCSYCKKVRDGFNSWRELQESK